MPACVLSGCAGDGMYVFRYRGTVLGSGAAGGTAGSDLGNAAAEVVPVVMHWRDPADVVFCAAVRCEQGRVLPGLAAVDDLAGDPVCFEIAVGEGFNPP